MPLQRKKFMKRIEKILFVAASAAVFSMVSANAQYQVVGENGIAASPKLRQLFNEKEQRTTVAPDTSVASASYRPTAEDRIAVSPKLRQLLIERRTVPSTPPAAVASVGYRPTDEDGITASPKTSGTTQ